MRVRLGFLSVLLFLLATLVPTGGHALLPPIGWIPNNIGLPFIATVASDGKPVPLYLTRRMVPNPTISGRFLLGNALFGLYQSVPGVGWTSLTPHCTPRLSTGIPSLDGPLGQAYNAIDSLGTIGCGVEGIAFDPDSPATVYASSYNLVLNLGNLNAPAIGYSGVFKAEIRVKNNSPSIDQRIPTAGIIWRRILPGIRGNALAVARPTPNAPARIAAGRIQASNSVVGTDSNPWCGPGCQPSLYLSENDGDTWQPYTFNTTACGAAVATSSKLVGNLSFDPVNKDVLYAGSNSGLWTGVKVGGVWQWTHSLVKCGSTPGFVATGGISPGARRIYIGTNDGKISTTTTGATGPVGVPTALTLSGGPIQGQILSVILDANDPTERTLIVSSWFTPSGPTPAIGTGGVYKVVVDSTYTSATVTDLKASWDNPIDQLNNATYDGTIQPALAQLAMIYDPRWRSSVFLTQHPLAPDLLFASTVLGGVWLRSGLTDVGAL